jgi:hypothetical protein
MTYENKLVVAGIWGGAAKSLAGGDMGAGLVATGSTQATALPIVNDINMFTTVAASTGAVLPAFGSAFVAVFNGGANSLAVYPPLGGTINGAAANTAFAVAAGKSTTFMSPDGYTWLAQHSA